MAADLQAVVLDKLRQMAADEEMAELFACERPLSTKGGERAAYYARRMTSRRQGGQVMAISVLKVLGVPADKAVDLTARAVADGHKSVLKEV